MDDDSTRQSVLFSDLAGKAVVAKFDQDHASSDGGAILLQACDRRLGLTDALIGGIRDPRQSGKIRHGIGDLVRQRLYAIACGYPDGNDAGRLGADPIQRLLCGRDPLRKVNTAIGHAIQMRPRKRPDPITRFRPGSTCESLIRANSHRTADGKPLPHRGQRHERIRCMLRLQCPLSRIFSNTPEVPCLAKFRHSRTFITRDHCRPRSSAHSADPQAAPHNECMSGMRAPGGQLAPCHRTTCNS